VIVSEIQNGLDSFSDDLDSAGNIFKPGVSSIRKQAHITFERLKEQIEKTIPEDKNFNVINAVRQD
jgi:hypothetical protein